MTLISVCICTYRRPSVAQTIGSVISQRLSDGIELEVIVADDDPAKSAQDLVTGLARSSDVKIKYIVSAARNISACRNLCLQTAEGEWIAFIDDDESAEPDWIAELWSASRQFQVAAIKGFVQAVYPDNTPSWIRDGDPFTSDCGPTGTRVMLGATGNVLIQKSKIIDHNLSFDLRLGRTGGEDREFFEQFRACGGNLVSCRSAIVYEHVPPARIEVLYLKNRSRRFGHIDGRVMVAKRSYAGRTWSLTKSVLAVMICACYPLAIPFSGTLPFQLFGRFWYHLGVIEWAAGRLPFEHE